MQITISGLTKRYPGGVTALCDVDLTISTGMYGLLGPNGAGKTTLMRILCTLLEPTAGDVTICGIDRRRDPQRVRELIGYLPQEFGFYRRLTAEEYLDFAGGMKGLSPAVRRRQIPELLERVNLADPGVRRRQLGKYSGGMKRRLGIAQALLGDPRVLVVDEPTAGLDPEERLRFRNLLSDLSRERIVLLSTHIVADIESVCTAVAVLDRGRVRFTGAPGDLLRRADGQVWLLELSDSEYARIRDGLKIISSRRTAEGMALRVLDTENPLGLSTPAAPTLEDGYLCLMEEVPS